MAHLDHLKILKQWVKVRQFVREMASPFLSGGRLHIAPV